MMDLIEKAKFDIAWEEHLQYLEPSVAVLHGTHTPEDLKLLVENGSLQCWFGAKSILLTEIINYPQKRALNLFLSGGNLDELLVIKESVEKFAKDRGCQLIFGVGRKGWEKFGDGYHGKFVFKVKEI